MPASWRAEEEPRPPRVVGAGMGLFGLRRVPLVGRVAERDVLWNTLATVRRSGSVRLVVLRGPTGVGKTRLAQWLAWRAHELGAATPLDATHGPAAGRSDGVAPMLAQHFRGAGLSRPALAARLEAVLTRLGATDAYEWSALTELISPARDANVPFPVRFDAPRERDALVRRVLARLAADRPVLLCLDDVPWGSEALGLARHLMEAPRQQSLPLLLVVTADDEALAERPAEAAALEALAKLPGSLLMHLGPLRRGDMLALVQELVVLDDDLAQRVADRVGGNPLFAVNLVGDWVQRGVLGVGHAGFVLRPGQDAVLPDDLHEIWGRRLERVLAGEPLVARSVLEIAAVLGTRVDPWEWQVACVEAGLGDAPAARPAAATSAAHGATLSAVMERLLERLAALALIRDAPQGRWHFAHEMVRESLERSAREAGRHRGHHRACARMLRRCYPRGEGGMLRRLARHLLEAEAWGEAVGPLLEAARLRGDASEFAAAHQLLQAREDALLRAEAGEDAPEWGAGWTLRARLYADQGLLDEAQQWARAAETQAARWVWPAIEADALAVLADVALERGDHGQASRSYRDALARYEAEGAATEVGSCLLGLGRADVAQGRLDDAAAHLSAALERFGGEGGGASTREMARCLRTLGELAWTRDARGEAADLYRRALALGERSGDRRGIGLSLAGLAEVARFDGDLPRAETLYQGALERLEGLEGPSETTRLNLGLVQVQRGRFSEARAVFESGCALLEGADRRGLLGCLHAILLACTAAEADWAAFDEHHQQALQLLGETGTVEPDVAWTAELAGDLAAGTDEAARARSAYDLALAQWRALGRQARAETVARRRAELPSEASGAGGASRD